MALRYGRKERNERTTMKAIQKLKNHFKNLIRKPLVKCSEESVGVTTRQKEPRPQRRRAAGTPCPKSTLQVAFSDSVSEKHLNGDSSCVTHFVLRHGLFLSLYSLIKKASGKLPWRSRTNNSDSSSTSTSTSSSYSRSSVSTSVRSFNTTRNYIKNFRRIRILGSASLFSLGLLLLATFVPLYNVTRTEDTEAAAGTAKDSSITFTATRSTASVDLTVTSENGTFASSTDGTNGTTDTRAAFSISTTNFTGYTLTIASNANTSTLSNGNGGTLSSISSPIDEFTFNTTAYNNKWGYKPNYYNSAANSNYLQSPTTTASTLDETSTANSTAKSYTIALGARADYTNASGTYSSSNYKLMYVANPVAYSITYADNSGDSTVANIPAVQSSDSITTTSINITSSTPTRTGYSFKSWCLGTVSSNGTVCTGTEYNPGASFGIDRTANKASNTATLTAVWTANKYTCTKQYRLQNADGSWGNYTTDTTEQVAYNSTCSYSKSVTNYKGSENGTNGSAATNSATMNSTNGITVQVSLYRNTFSCKIAAKYQNADGTYGTATNVVNSTLRYEQACSWSRNSDATYKAASYSTSISSNIDTTVSVDRNTYACSKQYRLQNADGTYPNSYTSVTGETIRYGATCSYSQSYTDYQTKSTSTTITAAATLSLDLPRNTYALTINRNTTYISSVSGAGTYRWGQSVSISATADTNSEFTGWSVSSGSTGSFGSTSSASTTYTMPKGASTIYADGKSSVIAFQSATSANCGQNMYDNRGTAAYKSIVYTTAKIGSLCWMTRNLDLPGGTTLTSSDTNLTTSFTLPASSTNRTFGSYDTDYVYNSGKTTCSSNSPCYSYYSFYTATAHWGTYNMSGNSSVDICPKGWRLPTQNEYSSLINSYSSGATLTASPWRGVYSGYYMYSEPPYATSLTFSGSKGYYWSSTMYRRGVAYDISFDNSSATVFSGIGHTYSGFAVRCVAKS